MGTAQAFRFRFGRDERDNHSVSQHRHEIPIAVEWTTRSVNPTKAQLPTVLKALRLDKTSTNVALAVGGTSDTGLPFRPGLPLKQLNALFARCHNAIRKIEKDEEHAFADFSKLLFLKLLEEKQDDGEIVLPYSYRFDELALTPAHKSDQIRDSVAKMIGQIQEGYCFWRCPRNAIHL